MFMIDKSITFLVRFAAMVCFVGLVSGYSSGNTEMIVVEVVFLLIWLQMDYKNVRRAFSEIKEKIKRLP